MLAGLRRRVALWVCPELQPCPSVATAAASEAVKLTPETILTALAAFCEAEGVSHWAVSMRIFRKGDFFAGLLAGKGCHLRTANRVMAWFSDNWPADLAWPRDVPRPPKTKKEAA